MMTHLKHPGPPPLPVANENTTVFSDALGAAWADILPSVRHFHTSPSDQTRTGTIMVQVAARPGLAFALRLVGMPYESGTFPLVIQVRRTEQRERWIRFINGKVYTTTLYNGGRNCIVERLGPLAVALNTDEKGNGIVQTEATIHVFGIPVPKALCPRILTTQYEMNGRYQFFVSLNAPFKLGPILHYSGWLDPP